MISMNKYKYGIENYQEKINSIQVNTDSIIEYSQIIESKLNRVGQTINNTSEDVQNINDKIILIKDQTDEKINNVDTYGKSQLQNYLTNRYN